MTDYRDDKTWLMHGDCLERMKEIPDGSVDMVLTDIPYGEVNRANSGLRNLDKGLADIVNFDLSKLCEDLHRVCSGSIYVFCGIEQVSEIRRIFSEKKCQLVFAFGKKPIQVR